MFRIALQSMVSFYKCDFSLFEDSNMFHGYIIPPKTRFEQKKLPQIADEKHKITVIIKQ